VNGVSADRAVIVGQVVLIIVNIGVTHSSRWKNVSASPPHTGV
jgi:hypothetical protein